VSGGEPLSLALELRPAAQPAGAAVLTNESDDTVRGWRQGNEWGDGALAFVVRRDGESGDATLTRKPQVYTRNVPSPVEIAPGDGHRIEFDVGDGEWEPPDVVQRLGGDAAQLAAVYEIAPTPESDEQQVWTGRVQSEFVSLR
jgi:hypothetical protein